MTVQATASIVHRPARTSSPARPPSATTIQRPPQVDEQAGGGMGFLGLIPLLGAAGSMTVMMLFRGSPFAAVGALMMIVTVTGAIVMLFSQRGKAGRRRRMLRDLYLEHLEDRRDEFLQEEREQRERGRSCDPLPQALHDVIADPHRLWERRRSHEDFLRVRLGTGTVPGPPIRLEGESQADQRPDPHLQQELRRLLDRFSHAPEMPLTVPLGCHRTVSVVGDEEFGHQVLRALLLSAAALHSPEDLQIAAAVPARHQDSWQWVSHLPHVLDQTRPTASTPLPRIAASRRDLRDLLDDEIRRRYQRFSEVRRNFLVDSPSLAQPRLLVADMDFTGGVSNLELPDPALSPDDLSITALHLVPRQQDEPEDVSLRILQTSEGLRIEDMSQDPLRPEVSQGVLPGVAPALARGLARMLSPLRLSPDSMEHSDDVDAERFTAHLGIREFSPGDLDRLWQARQSPDFLKVPIGVDDRGQPVNLDIKESAQHGMGPHGLCVGATGSGKSELLRTLVIGLAVTHPPDLLNMVLVDYKGGATFAPFAEIPHVAGIITNLSDDASLVDRIYDSLEGEVQRRQEVLKAAGNIANITDYQLHRAQRAREGETLAPLPHLFVVIDEFGELLTAQPDFIDLFMSIGRIGRSIGVHLLLSSQRIEAGKLRGLDTHLSYRLGLRTLSEAESRTVLETPDAFHLPPLPGYGYLKVDTTTYARFKAGYVSGPLSTETESPEAAAEEKSPVPVLLNSFYASEPRHGVDHDDLPDHPPGPAGRPALPDGRDVSDGQPDADQDPAAAQAAQLHSSGPTVLSALVDLMAVHDRISDPIWLPPLPDSISLDAAVSLDPAAPTSGADVVPPRLPRTDQLQVPIGVLDAPARQWQGMWTLDLTRSGGHVAILGGPSSGKSTALRTVSLALAATHTVEEVALFGVDLKGSGLQPLRDLPHSAGMAGRTSREALRRTVEEVSDLLDEREKIFEDRGIDTLATMRRMHAAGELEELDVADVVLLVDGWGGLLEEFDELQEPIFGILARGGGYGVHVLAAATRWNEIRVAQQSFFGTRLELRLSEPAESAHGRKTAERIPADRAGRGLNHDELIGQIALPRIDGEPDQGDLDRGLREAVAAIAQATPRRSPRQVRLLPHVVTESMVRPDSPDDADSPVGAGPDGGSVPLGLVERDLSPKHLDVTGQERHVLVMGDELCGKSSLLRHLMLSMAEQHSPEQIVFAVYDPRRTLHGVLPEELMGGYATSAMLAQNLTTSVVQELRGRVPEDPLAAHSTGFEGPRVVLVVDDYDVLTAGGSAPLREFAEFLPMGAEIGLHALVARRIRGASRGLFEPFTAALREAGGATFMMDGDPSEGALVNGVRPRRQPPGRGIYLHGGRAPATIQAVFREEHADDAARP